MTFKLITGPMKIFMRKFIYKVLTFLCLYLVWPITAFADAPAVVSVSADGNYYQPLAPYMLYHVDDDRQKSFQDILASPDILDPITTKYPDFGLTKGRIWLHARVANPSDADGIWRLNIGRQFFQELDVYVLRGAKPPEQIMDHNDRQPFYQRPIASRMLMVDLPVASGETVDVYVAYRSFSTTYLPLGIGSIEGTSKVHTKEFTIDWVLNAVLVALIFFTLLMGSIIGWKLAISFAAYILAGILYVMQADSYTFQYFWPNMPWLNDRMNLIFMMCMMTFGLNFARQLFNFREVSPRWDNVLKYAVILSVILSILSFFFIDYNPLMIFAYSVIPVGTVMQMVCGLTALRQKMIGALPYMIGALLVFSSFVYATLAHIIPGQFNLDTTLDYGHIILISECIVFAIAIVLRLLSLRAQRDAAIRAELLATQQKLAISADLQNTKDDYINARRLSDLRRDQMSAISHDLQQPLASMRASLASLESIDEETAGQMHAAFDYLEKLARDQITAAKSDGLSGIVHAREYFAVNVILDNAYEMFKDEAAEKGLELVYNSVRTYVHTDPLGLMRVVSNLLSNAIKHTEAGTVSLRAEQDANRVTITVSDTGPGMSIPDQNKLLKVYQKGVNSTGYGLGLPIVSTLAQELGLQFSLRSSLGQGTECEISLPATSE